MAKNGKFWLKFLVAIGVLLLGFAVGYGMLSQKVEDNTSHIETTKTEGCLPARQSKTDIAVLKEGQKTILGKLDELLEK